MERNEKGLYLMFSSRVIYGNITGKGPFLIIVFFIGYLSRNMKGKGTFMIIWWRQRRPIAQLRRGARRLQRGEPFSTVEQWEMVLPTWTWMWPTAASGNRGRDQKGSWRWWVVRWEAATLNQCCCRRGMEAVWPCGEGEILYLFSIWMVFSVNFKQLSKLKHHEDLSILSIKS